MDICGGVLLFTFLLFVACANNQPGAAGNAPFIKVHDFILMTECFYGAFTQGWYRKM